MAQLTNTALALSLILAPAPAEPAEAAGEESVDVPAPTVTTAPQSAPRAYEDRVAAALGAHTGGLTSDEVARRAVVNSPTIELRRAELMETASSVDNTISQFAPNITLTATYSRISPAEVSFGSGASVGALNEGPLSVDPMGGVVDAGGLPVMAVAPPPLEIPQNNYSLQAALTVPILDYALRLMPAKRGAEQRTEAAIQQREAEKVKVELEARVAYYDWIRSVAQIAIVEQSVSSMRARLEDARIGLNAGTLTETDVERLEQLVADAELSVMQARSFSDLAAANLAVIMQSEESHFEVGEDVLNAPSAFSGKETKEELIEEAVAQRLELKALGANETALKHAERSARSAYYPRVDGFADFTYANPNQRFFPATNEWNSNWTLGVSASWQLRTFLSARSQVKSVKASQRTMAANAAAVRRGVVLEVTSAYEERRRAIEAQAINARAVAAAKAVYEQQVAMYSAGEVTTTDLIVAESERLNASLRQVNTRVDLRVADAKLLRATGRMKPMAVEADADDRQYESVGLGKGGK
jgi:outer membrane protein TolC